MRRAGRPPLLSASRGDVIKSGARESGERPSWWLRWGRRFLPARVWDGAGVIVDKVHREPYTGATLVPIGTGTAMGSGTVPERWVLVVRDRVSVEHYVNVERPVWEGHEIGDRITAAYPLVGHR